MLFCIVIDRDTGGHISPASQYLYLALSPLLAFALYLSPSLLSPLDILIRIGTQTYTLCAQCMWLHTPTCICISACRACALAHRRADTRLSSDLLSSLLFSSPLLSPPLPCPLRFPLLLSPPLASPLVCCSSFPPHFLDCIVDIVSLCGLLCVCVCVPLSLFPL